MLFKGIIMRKTSIVDLSHHILKPLLSSEDVYVDATMGNGFDTVFLAKHAKKVYAFDIQDDAVLHTKTRCENERLSNVLLIKDSHESILTYVKDFKGVIFNLGYLPKGDKTITTQTETTLKTLTLLLNHIKKDDFIAVTCYPGHLEGAKEEKAVFNLLKTLDPLSYKVLRLDLPFTTNQSPVFYLITKTV